MAKDPRKDKKADRFTKDFIVTVEALINNPHLSAEGKLKVIGLMLAQYDSREKRSKGYATILRFFAKPLFRVIKPQDYIFNIGRKRLRLQMNRTLPEGDKGRKMAQAVIDYMTGILGDEIAASRFIKHKRERVPSSYKDTFTFSEDFWDTARNFGVEDDILWIINPDPSLYSEPVPKKDISQKT